MATRVKSDAAFLKAIGVNQNMGKPAKKVITSKKKMADMSKSSILKGLRKEGPYK